jgi:Flp pilus assembly protein TadG
MMVTPMQKILFGSGRLFAKLIHDRQGVAAVEFAVIVPVMLTLFFGLVEFSNGVAADRKVSLVARTLSDLTSQAPSVVDSDLANFNIVANAILTPYAVTPTTPLVATITELYIHPTTGVAKVIWSKGSAPLSGNVTIPSQIQVNGTYLIMAQIEYRYIPAVGYIMASTGVVLKDVAYTRPRVKPCVIYSASPIVGALPSCPT